MLDRHGVVLGGDMLTRERLQNAKNIRLLALTTKAHFQHLAPVTCELWHVKQDLLAAEKVKTKKQEHAIRNKKDIIRGLGANKTENATRRASGSANIIYKIRENIDKLMNIPKSTTSHTKKTSSKDVELAINILRKVDPFIYVKGRKFDSYKEIPKNPKTIVKRKDLVCGIHKKNSKVVFELLN
ncbi:unnamed protein product [Mytilus coruscus]|uniref:Uncharacterized protein n=1 Tax=Mytilus coruscus TaxID=42192 RepID=A0A6J8BR79_MYTCO|nr:unnamed protein product [Mytilus coruscus]